MSTEPKPPDFAGFLLAAEYLKKRYPDASGATIEISDDSVTILITDPPSEGKIELTRGRTS